MRALHLTAFISCFSFLNHTAASVTLMLFCVWAVNQIREVIWVKNNPEKPPNLDQTCSAYVVWPASCIGCVSRVVKAAAAALGAFSGNSLNFLEEVARVCKVKPYTSTLKWKQKPISPALICCWSSGILVQILFCLCAEGYSLIRTILE